jgi:hypothetical protein
MANMFSGLGDVTITAEGVVETVADPASNSNAIRVGNSERKHKDDGELPSNKLKKVAHGTANFRQYQEACRAYTTATATMVQAKYIWYRAAAKSI